MRPSHLPRGFTLLEMAVAVAIIATVTAMSVAAFRTTRYRSDVSAVALDLRALLHGARSEALATGHDVAVLVYPDFPTPAGGTGRVIVYSDGARSFFSAAAPTNFESFAPDGSTAVAPGSEALDEFDLPRTLRFGPATGAAPNALVAPYDTLPVNSDCTFCLAAGLGGRRGAIVFNYRGEARFQAANGAPAGPLAGVVGGSFSIQSTEIEGELRTIAIVAATGSARSMQFKLH